MVDHSSQVNVPATLPRDLINLDVNDCAKFPDIFNRENCYGDTLIHRPDLAQLVVRRFLNCVNRSTLSPESETGRKQEYSYAGNEIDLHWRTTSAAELYSPNMTPPLAVVNRRLHSNSVTSYNRNSSLNQSRFGPEKALSR